MIEDKLKAELDRAVDRAGIVDRIDAVVISRARRRMAYSVGVVALACVAIVGVSAWLVTKPLYHRQERIVPQPADQYPPSHGLVREDIPERRRAEVFAFRAFAGAGLIEPFGSRTYMWTSEDTVSERGRWRIGFHAADCTPRGKSIGACRPLRGEVGEGNARSDTYAVVALDGTSWRVVDVEGNILPEERDRVLGFSLPDRREPSHWEFAAGAAASGAARGWIEMVPIWVGPFPTRAPGSVCSVQLIDEGGAHLGEPTTFYVEPPRREFEARGAWRRGMGGGDVRPDDADVNCHQRTGPGWQVASVELLRHAGRVLGVTLRLEWHGGTGFTSPAVCSVALVDDDGEVVSRGTGRLGALWREGELKHYPYKAELFIRARDPVDAAAADDARCKSP